MNLKSWLKKKPKSEIVIFILSGRGSPGLILFYDIRMLTRLVFPLVLCSTFLSLCALAPQYVCTQDQPVRSIPNGIVLTASGTLQAAQGELHLFVGDRADLAPALFRPGKQGGMDFSMPFGDHDYLFHAADVVIESTRTSLRACVIDATAIARPKAESEAVIWCAWRHQPLTTGKGMILAADGSLQDTIEQPLPWQDNWTWFFKGGAYHRQDRAVYFIEHADGWSRSTWVRPPQKPYQPLLPDGLTGYTRLSRKLLANQSASLRIYVPFTPTEPAELSKITFP